MNQPSFLQSPPRFSSALVGILIVGALLAGLNRGGRAAEAGGGSNVYLPLINKYALPPSIFGVEFYTISNGAGLQEMLQAGAYWVRRNAVLWSDVQPSQGSPPNWNVLNQLESEMVLAQNSGMEPIIIVRSTPEWAQDQSISALCGPIDPAFLPDFGAFMFELVERYSAPPFNIKYWEIWNEPDVDPSLVPEDYPFGCWGDEDDPYYGGRYFGDMLQVITPQIKAADPDAQVLVGGLLLDCDPNDPPAGKDCTSSLFLEGILVSGAGDSFDAVSFHAYDYYSPGSHEYLNTNWQSPGDMLPVLVAKVAYLKSVLAQYGFSNKSLINTETALVCGGGNDPPGGPGCEATNNSPFEIMKRDYVPQSYAAAIAEGLFANLWYTPLGYRNSGLLYSNLAPRPAYHAYDLAQELMTGSIFLREITEFSNVHGYEFLVSTGRLWVLWTEDGDEETITLPGAPFAAFDSVGVSVPVNNNEVTFDIDTIYIDWRP